MRITGGEFGGRNLKVPKSDTIRPTQDRVREAVFNIIQFEVPGCDFLDLFAGSGAVGLEALSRGAKSATFVEANRRHIAVLNENLEMMAHAGGTGVPPVRTGKMPVPRGEAMGRTGKMPVPRGEATVVTGDCYRWLATYSGPGFSIGFADPPYALGEEKGYASVLATLAERGVIREGGLFIAEMTAVQKAEETPGWELVRDRVYGKTRICMWRRSNVRI